MKKEIENFNLLYKLWCNLVCCHFGLFILILPKQVLVYTAGHINYGGRITDDWDRRCVLTILQDFYKPEILSTSHKFDEEGYYAQVCSITNNFIM